MSYEWVSWSDQLVCVYRSFEILLYVPCFCIYLKLSKKSRWNMEMNLERTYIPSAHISRGSKMFLRNCWKRMGTSVILRLKGLLSVMDFLVALPSTVELIQPAVGEVLGDNPIEGNLSKKGHRPTFGIWIPSSGVAGGINLNTGSSCSVGSCPQAWVSSAGFLSWTTLKWRWHEEKCCRRASSPA